jgi:hypothetical protein
VEELLFACGDYRDLSSRREVVPEVRTSLCPSAPVPASQSRRQVAPGRGVTPDEWRAALPLAGRRQDGHVLDIPVQSRRNKKPAKTSFRNPLKGLTYAPWVIITDKLKSYGAA